MFFNKIKIAGKPYAAIPCTAYLPTLGETEADRRDMMIVDANAYVDTDEISCMLIPEYLDEGEEIAKRDAAWSTDRDDLSTAIHDGEWFDAHAARTDDEHNHDETKFVRASVNSYGGQASYSGRRGDESVDVLDVTIPGDAFLYATEHRLIAESVIDDAETYDETASYQALCEMIAGVMETLAHRLIKPVIIPLSECGGEDLIVEPVKPYDDEDHSFDDDDIIKGVKVETV